ncbi:MAG: response regulator [Planctomycetota bacterium]|nr:response regulator [Planctomycetota bacterium]
MSFHRGWLVACVVFAVLVPAASSQEVWELSVRAVLQSAQPGDAAGVASTRMVIEGVVTVDPFSARGGRVMRTYVQDETAAIRCVARVPSLLDGVGRGQRVNVTGVLGSYRGMPQLHIDAIEPFGFAECPPPLPVEVGQLGEDRLLGQVVEIVSELVPPVLKAPAVLREGEHAIPLYMPERFLRDRALAELVDSGQRVCAVGVLERNQASGSSDPGYRIRLLSPEHLKGMGHWLLGPLSIFVGILLVLLGTWFVWHRLVQRKLRSSASWALVVARDSARQMRMQSHKMEALGTLAGGIAHDFNNYLLAMIGYAELARSELPQGSAARGHLDEVLTTGDRAKELVGKILKFGRKGDSQLTLLDSAEVVLDGLVLLRAVLPANVQLVEEVDLLAGNIRANANQLHQVLLNLGSNAADAMQEAGGDLHVSLTRVEANAALAADVQLARPGPCALLTISDDGLGMDEATLSRAFDPFFTTKRFGEGAGLGLSVVHGILGTHGAGLSVRSSPGEGASFEIFLPVSESPVVCIPRPEGEVRKGSERVLLVDDEASLAELGARQLQKLGYKVQTETDSDRAIALFLARPEAFDVVVTDYAMPGSSGLELAASIKRRRPDIPILLTTGFGQKLAGQEVEVEGIDQVLEKPYRMAELARAVGRLLDAEPNARPDSPLRLGQEGEPTG